MKIASRLVCLLIFVLCMSAPGPARAGNADDWPAMADFPQFPPAALPAPIVTVKVRVPACADASKNLEYRILVENCSPAAAHRVVVLDQLPANAKFVRASPPPHRTEPELQWQLGTLKANSCQEITLVLAPTNAEDVANCVRVQFEHGVCVTTRRTGSAPRTKLPDEQPIPKGPSTKEPPLAGGAKVELKVKGLRQQAVHDPARYFITVTNVGTGPAREVSIEADVPDKLTFVSASDKGRFFASEGKAGWSLGILPANASLSVELVVRAKEKGVFCLKTRAQYDLKPEKFTPVEETCTTFIGGVPAMLLEMYDRDDPIPVNGTTSYPIWITNPGSAPVTNVRIQAKVSAGMEFLHARPAGKYKVEGKTVIFEPLPSLEPGAKMEYEVYTRALLPGDMRFQMQMTADQLKEGGPVREEESTTVYSEDLPAPAQTQSRRRTLRAIAVGLR